MIELAKLWKTQRHIDQHKVSRLLCELREAGGFRAKALLRECEDGEYEIVDGHHRLTALYLSGRKTLTYGEAVIVYSERSQKRFGKLGEQ